MIGQMWTKQNKKKRDRKVNLIMFILSIYIQIFLII